MHCNNLFWTILFMGLLQLTIRVTGKAVPQGNDAPIGVAPVVEQTVDGTPANNSVIQHDEEDVGEQEEEEEEENEVTKRPENDSTEWGGLTQTDKELIKVLDQILAILKGSKVAELAEVKKAIKNIELYKEDILSVVGK